MKIQVTCLAALGCLVFPRIGFAACPNLPDIANLRTVSYKLESFVGTYTVTFDFPNLKNQDCQRDENKFSFLLETPHAIGVTIMDTNGIIVQETHYQRIQAYADSNFARLNFDPPEKSISGFRQDMIQINGANNLSRFYWGSDQVYRPIEYRHWEN